VKPLSKHRNNGLLAQLVERFVYTEDVGSSSLSQPTIPPYFKSTASLRLLV
jgi:hypothetical protein